MENGRKNRERPCKKAGRLHLAEGGKGPKLLLSHKLSLPALVIFQDYTAVVAAGGSCFRLGPAPACWLGASPQTAPGGGRSSGSNSRSAAEEKAGRRRPGLHAIPAFALGR